MKIILKRIFLLLLISFFVLASCAPRPQYKTRKGRKKLKIYNMHQFDNYRIQKYEKKHMKH